MAFRTIQGQRYLSSGVSGCFLSTLTSRNRRRWGSGSSGYRQKEIHVKHIKNLHWNHSREKLLQVFNSHFKITKSHNVTLFHAVTRFVLFWEPPIQQSAVLHGTCLPLAVGLECCSYVAAGSDRIGWTPTFPCLLWMRKGMVGEWSSSHDSCSFIFFLRRSTRLWPFCAF